MMTTVIGLAAVLAVVVVGLVLAALVGRVLFGAGRGGSAKELRRAAREQRWTGGGSGV